MIRPEYAQIVVPAHMAEEYRLTQRKEQVGMQKVTKMRGILKPEAYEVERPVYETVEEWVPTGQPSDTEVDVDDFAKRIALACNDLHEDGYDVISVTPVLRGVYGHNHNAGVMEDGTGIGGWGYGFGYSITDSMVVLGKLRPDEPREVPDPPGYISPEEQMAMEEEERRLAAEAKAKAEAEAEAEARSQAEAPAQPAAESAPQTPPPAGTGQDGDTENQS